MVTNASMINYLKHQVWQAEEYIAEAQIDLKFAEENLTDLDIHEARETLDYYFEVRDTALYKIEFYSDPSNNVDTEF